MVETTDIVPSGMALWQIVVTAVLGYMGYTAKKRDDATEENGHRLNMLSLDLERNKTQVAETYATKATMMDLFKETTRTNEMAIARVEDSIKTTNATIVKQGDKIDHVSNTINTFQTNVMAELAKKT